MSVAIQSGTLRIYQPHLELIPIWANSVVDKILTLKVPITTAADDIFFFFFFFSEKISLDISCESIHIKCQDLFSLKNKKKIKNRMSSATNFAWHFKG